MKQDNIEYDTPLPENAGFPQWTQMMIERQDKLWEQLSRVSYTLDDRIIVNFMGDLHIGHPSTHYSRIQEEVDAIMGNPKSYVVLTGDLIDGMHWNPGQFEQQEQIPEQIMYVQSLLEHLAQDGSLILAVQGDHDGWVTKMGWNMYAEMHKYGAHAANGPTAMEINMKTADLQYRIGVAHRLPGHSIYNPNHPQMRAEREIFRGSDIVVSGHNHRKGHSRSYVTEWSNVHPVDNIALGAYKPTDSWLKKQGYRPQRTEQMYGSAVVLEPYEKYVQVFDDILRANR